MTGMAIDVAAWSSRWRDREPRDKVVLAVGLVVCALALPAWPGSLVVTALAVLLAVGPAGVDPRVLAQAARGPLAFIALGAVSIALTRSTGPGPDVLGLTITAESLGRAGSTTAHAVAGTSAVLLLATTTPMSDLLAWLRKLGMPEAVVDIAGLVYRLLFVLLASAEQVRSAQAARLGYASWRASFRSAAALAAAVLVRAWSRARRLEDGLAGRGLEGPLRVLDDPRVASRRFALTACAVPVAVAAGSMTVHVLTGPVPW